MLKRFLALILSVFLLSSTTFAFAGDGFGDNNTNVEDTFDETIGWLELTDASSYELKDGYVLFVQKNTDVDSFKSNFYNPLNVSIVNSDGTVVKTGDIVRYNDIENDDHKIIVVGDVDCNGQTTVSDLTILLKHILDESVIDSNSPQYVAADIDMSKSLNVVDLTAMLNVVLN